MLLSMCMLWASYMFRSLKGVSYDSCFNLTFDLYPSDKGKRRVLCCCGKVETVFYMSQLDDVFVVYIMSLYKRQYSIYPNLRNAT